MFYKSNITEDLELGFDKCTISTTGNSIKHNVDSYKNILLSRSRLENKNNGKVSHNLKHESGSESNFLSCPIKPCSNKASNERKSVTHEAKKGGCGHKQYTILTKIISNNTYEPQVEVYYPNFKGKIDFETKLMDSAENHFDKSNITSATKFEKEVDITILGDGKDDPMSQLEFWMKHMKISEKLNQPSNMEKVINCLHYCREACRDVPLVDALEICEDLLKVLEYNKEHLIVCKKIKDEMAKIISDAVKEEFRYWNVSLEGRKGAQLMALAREVILLIPWPPSKGNKIMLEVFDRMILKNIFPKIKEDISSWDLRHPKQILEILDVWELLLTHNAFCDVKNSIYHQLEKTIENWDPINETIMLESWIYPWVKVFGTKIQNFYPIISHCLAKALVNVEAKEITPLMMMKAGLSVLNERFQLKFLLTYIVPKLVLHLKGMVLYRNFNSLKKVTDWVEYLPTNLLADMLKEMFFPKLIKTIAMQIFLGKFESASTGLWLAGWLNKIPEKLKNTIAIQLCIHDAMTLIMHGVNLEATKTKKS